MRRTFAPTQAHLGRRLQARYVVEKNGATGRMYFSGIRLIPGMFDADMRASKKMTAAQAEAAYLRWIGRRRMY